MRRVSRKADLALSTNAIVVMIIAIVVLGLALTFTRTIFQKLTGQIGNIGEQSIDEPATYDDPMTLTSSTLEITRSQNKVLGISVYNKFTINDGCFEGTEKACNMKISIIMGECMGYDKEGNIINYGPSSYPGYDDPVADFGITPSTSAKITISPLASKDILLNKEGSFSTKVQVAASTPPGDYPCTLLAINAGTPNEGESRVLASEDIIITVK